MIVCSDERWTIAQSRGLSLHLDDLVNMENQYESLILLQYKGIRQMLNFQNRLLIMHNQVTYIIVGNIKGLSDRFAWEISIIHNVTDDVENCR